MVSQVTNFMNGSTEFLFVHCLFVLFLFCLIRIWSTPWTSSCIFFSKNRQFHFRARPPPLGPKTKWRTTKAVESASVRKHFTWDKKEGLVHYLLGLKVITFSSWKLVWSLIYLRIFQKKGQELLAPGMKGVLVTCNQREKLCVREAYNLLNEVKFHLILCCYSVGSYLLNTRPRTRYFVF